jgi:hypothetical protein
MNERLKELVRQAKPSPNLIWEDAELERFAELVRQDEREACAKLCENLAMEVANKNFIAIDQRQFCAKQIRARSKK